MTAHFLITICFLLTFKIITGSYVADWRQSGCVSQVEDQENCGACYAFATLSVLETQLCLLQSQKEPSSSSSKTPILQLSVQELIDCSRAEKNAGCGGGNPSYALKYIFNRRKSRLMSEKCYQFVGNDDSETCQTDLLKDKQSSCIVDVSLNNTLKHKMIFDRFKMEEHLKTVGPLIGLIYSTKELEMIGKHCIIDKTFVFENNSNYDPDEHTPGHAIAIIGFGVDDKTNKPFWLVQNSWSDRWADRGRLRILRGNNILGIEEKAWAFYVK